jgi:predicted ATPase/class 3 adenylate cyclase/Tfp pilus assembly protein PilF
MADLPTGTITFLLTDIQGSSRLWEQYPEAMSAAVTRHDALLTACLEDHGGIIIRSRGEGDSFFAVFARASDAVAAACALQQALLADPLTSGRSSADGSDPACPTPLWVRVGIHTGEAELRGGDYYGPAINRCARLRAIGHGGQTLLSRAAADLVWDHLPARASLRDLGSHRLKDLQQPEQVYQLLHPDLPADFPPLTSLEVSPHNLPQQLTSFIGREREIEELRALLDGSAETSSPRLVTLLGPGGCGKTRLALQVAADLLDAYRDGVWQVELAALTDPTLVPQAVASAVGVREEPGRPLSATLIEYFQPRQLLLVLDNCEHLVAASAALVHELLRTCPRLRVLATSREVLGVPGEMGWRVPSLSLPEERKGSAQRPVPGARSGPGTGHRALGTESLMACEAPRLFIERARSSQPQFALTEENARAVVQICRRLDGLPLAIELAAARVRLLPVEQIAARLDDRFRLLSAGSRTLLPRQQTLRALIDWSYDLLSEPERAFWRRLSVFAGGFMLEAAEAVCSDEVDSSQLTVDSGKENLSSLSTVNCQLSTFEILDLLTSLVDKSLVLAEEPSAESWDVDVEPRYRLLETIRQYGAELLQDAAEETALRERHAAYYLRFAEEAETHLRGAEQRAWLERLETEHANLRAALAWWTEQGKTEAGLRMAGALWRFWTVRGYLAEGRARLAELLTRAPSASEDAASPVRAKALHGAGALAWSQGDYPAARAFYQESLTVWRELGDHRGAAASLSNLGTVATEQGDYEAALSLYEESLAIYRELQDPRGIALSLNNMGLISYHRGDDARARELYEESLQIKRTLGDEHGIANSLTNLGHVAARQGDHAAARALYEESLERRRELGDRGGIALTLRELGNVAYCSGDLAAAQAFYEESLEIEQELGNRRGIATALGSLGMVALSHGEHAQARTLYQESLGLYREVGDQSEIAECLEGLAGVAGAQGEAVRAARLFGAADALREAVGVPREPADPTGVARHLAAARAALGEAAFDAAWAEGRGMALEEAVGEALAPFESPNRTCH